MFFAHFSSNFFAKGGNLFEYRYATKLSELGAPVEMHIYPVGCHGLGLATGDPKREPVEYVQRWIEDLERWLKLMKWINE